MTMHEETRDFWAPMELELGRCRHWRLGPLRIWVQRTNQEWRLASETGNEGLNELIAGSAEDKPAALEWGRWMASGEDRKVQLKPAMPDRPVIVRPSSPLHILPGDECVFYVGIAVWLKVCVGDKLDTRLSEAPSVIQSKTWFGDPTSGFLCYSMKTLARRSIDETETEPHRATCAFRIRNRHTTHLKFERLCLQTQHLKVFRTEDGLRTNDIAVVYQGDSNVSRVRYEDRFEGAGDDAELLADVRVPISRSILRQTFDHLRNYKGH